MAPVHRACGRSDDTARGNSRRKRRRRCKGRDHSNMLPAITSTTRHWDSATSSVEDAENSSTSSVENRDNKNPTDCDLLRKYCPSRFYTAFPVPRKRAVNRKQDGKKLLFHPSHSAWRRASWMVTQKNALVQLNELRPGLRYDVISKTGPLHAPVFAVGVEVNGFHFEGQGPTKKQAKMRAAERALHSFVQFPNASQAHASIGTFSSAPTDFTGDKLDLPDPFLRDFEPSLHENYDTLHSSAAKNKVFPNSYNPRQLVKLTLDLASSAKSKRQTLSIPSEEHLSPVVLLNVLRPGLRYICLTERVHGRPARSFVMVVRVEGRVFEGCGHSKRLAKAQAAAAALQAIYNISLGPEKILTNLQGSTTKNQLPQFFAESVFHLVREKYTELANSCSSTSHARHKVLAGVVMTRGFDLRSAQVVSLATGTKCLDTNSVSDRSVTLGDCHAEVIARRALLRFLYAQIELLLRNPADCPEQSIFIPSKTSNGHKVFQLRDGIHFHMYVSSSPCGDTRLNCPYETTAACPGQRFRCHLRVKVNGGEGTLPIAAQRIHPTWDRAAQSKHLVTVSCTDKLAKWSVVGLQGALLSRLVEPVYLHSLTVGTLCHTGHLGRTLARRIAPVKHLPFPYRRRQLLLSCLSNSQVRPAGKAPNVSVNWSCGDAGLEEISTSTGRRKESGTPSRLCRRSMFVCWHRLQQQLNGADISSGTYFSSKMASGCYQRAMQQFTAALQTCGLGTWLRKPPELNDFHISTT